MYGVPLLPAQTSSYAARCRHQHSAMIGISSHYVRRKYIYGGNLEYQARRAQRGNALGRRTPPPRLPSAFSIEIHRLADKLRP